MLAEFSGFANLTMSDIGKPAHGTAMAQASATMAIQAFLDILTGEQIFKADLQWFIHQPINGQVHGVVGRAWASMAAFFPVPNS